MAWSYPDSAPNSAPLAAGWSARRRPAMSAMARVASLARAGGAVAGAIVGQAVEEAVTRKEGQEMIIKLDSGKSVVITQTSPPGFRMGERVAVVSGGGGPARVTYP